MLETVTGIDATIVAFVNQFAGRAPLFDHIVWAIVENRLAKGGVVLAIFWWCWFRYRTGSAGERQAGIAMVMGAFVAMAISRGMQMALVARPRPSTGALVAFTSPGGGNPATLIDVSSFPSDHAALYFAVATGIALMNVPAGWLAFAWATGVICLPRLYVGLHYPSDLAVGAMIGALSTLACTRLALTRQISDAALRWEAAAPAWFYAIAFALTLQMAFIFQETRGLLRLVWEVGTSLAAASPVP
jgi:undecaprenyl-diphosphatase